MWNHIIHPDLFTNNFSDLTDFYAHTCTIQEATITYDAAGGEVFTWANKAGHVDLPCVIAPAGGDEIKQSDMTYVVASHTISIPGLYPLIQEKMRVVANTYVFDVLLAQIDSQNGTTHIDAQILT